MGPAAGAAAAETLIDLGELVDGGAPADRDDGPVRLPRWLVPVLVLLVALGGLAADTTRVRLLPTLATPAEPGDYEVVGDTLYVYEGSNAPNRITAYGLDDGRRHWQLQSPGTTRYEQLIEAGGRTVLIPNPCIASAPVVTVALDTRTGREVWRRPGTAFQKVAGSSLVVVSGPDARYDCLSYPPIDAAPQQWEAVDAGTGRVAWTLEVPRSDRVSFDWYPDGSRRVVIVTPDGGVTSRDLRTGAVTGRLTLPELARPVPQGPGEAVSTGSDVVVAAGLLLLVPRPEGAFSQHPTRVTLSAYDVATLSRRWSSAFDVGPVTDNGGYSAVGLSDCGDAICAYGETETVILDPRDGRERWRTDLSLLAVEGGRALLARRDDDSSPPEQDGLSVRDLDSGAVLADLPGWKALTGTRSSSGLPVLGFTVDNRTWFARIDLPRARVDVLGSEPGLYYSCLTDSQHLACRRIDGAEHVWRTPDG